MKKIFFFFILSFSVNAQEMIQGKLVLEDLTSTKVSVKNKQSNEIVETNWNGIFKMNMKENDTLVFFQKDVVFDEMLVSKDIISNKSFRYILSKEGTLLKDLIIDKAPIISFGGKSLTAAEKLEHQNSIKKVENNSIGVTLDGVFNRLSGRSKLIKKVKSMEDNERDFNAFQSIYSNETLNSVFKVPKNQITAFIYYIIDQEDFNRESVSLSEKYQLYLQEQFREFEKEYEL